MSYRFLLSGKWLGWLLIVALLAAVCVVLGNWQMDRRDQARATIAAVETHYDADPVPFAKVPKIFATADDSVEWTPVVLNGKYDDAGQRIVRNRPLNGRPGYEVLIPLRLQDGQAVIINRGWLPIGNNQAGHPDTIPAAPKGEVTVVARVKPGEGAVNRGAPEGQLRPSSWTPYAAELDYPLLDRQLRPDGGGVPRCREQPAEIPNPPWMKARTCRIPCSGTPSGCCCSSVTVTPRGSTPTGRSIEKEEGQRVPQANPAPRPSPPEAPAQAADGRRRGRRALDAQGFRTDGTLHGRPRRSHSPAARPRPQARVTRSR